MSDALSGIDKVTFKSEYLTGPNAGEVYRENVPGMYTEEGNSTKYSCIILEKILGYNKRLYLINDKYFCFYINTDAIDY